MKTTLLILVMLFLSSCSSNTNNWPRGMTPFFAECEGEGGTYTDNAYHKRHQTIHLFLHQSLLEPKVILK